MLKRILFLLFFLIISAHASDNNHPSSALVFQPILSIKQLHPLLLHAKKKSHFVLIDFNKKKCAPCLDLQNKTFSDTRVQTALRNYRLIEINLTNHNLTSFKKRFNVKSAPTLVFIDQGGQFLPEFTITGFVTPEQLLSVIARVQRGNEN